MRGYLQICIDLPKSFVGNREEGLSVDVRWEAFLTWWNPSRTSQRFRRGTCHYTIKSAATMWSLLRQDLNNEISSFIITISSKIIIKYQQISSSPLFLCWCSFQNFSERVTQCQKKKFKSNDIGWDSIHSRGKWLRWNRKWHRLFSFIYCNVYR